MAHKKACSRTVLVCFILFKVMRSFVLLCVSQLFSSCTGDVVFTLEHADAQPCTMYNCFFVRLAATIKRVPLKYCLHDVARKSWKWISCAASKSTWCVCLLLPVVSSWLRRYSRWVYSILLWLLWLRKSLENVCSCTVHSFNIKTNQ